MSAPARSFRSLSDKRFFPPLRAAADLLLIAVIVISLNISAGIFFRGARIDLTERNLYSLAEGAKRLISQMERKITIRLFFSKRLAASYPALFAQGERVADLLRQMAALSDGKIALEIIDPEPFSAEEDRAIAYGVRGIPTREGELLYFGLHGVSAFGGEERIPFFSPMREDYQQYDIARLIEALARPRKEALGLVTSLPFDTGAGGLPAAMEGRAKPFALYQEMRERFDLTFLEQDFRVVPDRLRVLMVAHPKPLSEATLYAIDQFVMRGGRLLLFLDPWSELSLVSSGGELLRGSRRQSDLKPLLESWGILYSPEEVVADRARAMRVAAGGDPRDPLADYVLWLALEGESIGRDAITSQLDRVHLASAGRLRAAPDYQGAVHPLLMSSADSAILPPPASLKSASPRALLESFAPQGERHILAARFSGSFKSAFAKPPPDPAEKPDALAEAPRPDPIARTAEGEIVIFADSDLFDDRFWVAREAFPTGEALRPIADNGKIVMNAIDWLMGSDALIALRARERARRPFLKMEELRQRAEERYRAEERALEKRVAEIEKAISDNAREGEGRLDAGRLDAAAAASDMRAALLKSRRALRDVRGKLRADMENLANRLLFLNIALTPFLVLAAALLLTLWRRRRQ